MSAPLSTICRSTGMSAISATTEGEAVATSAPKPRTRSPFPGMDPWLEHPAWWPNVHQSLITYSRDALQHVVGDRYFVSIGERVYVETSDHSYYPDVSIVEQRRGRARERAVICSRCCRTAACAVSVSPAR